MRGDQHDVAGHFPGPFGDHVAHIIGAHPQATAREQLAQVGGAGAFAERWRRDFGDVDLFVVDPGDVLGQPVERARDTRVAGQFLDPRGVSCRGGLWEGGLHQNQNTAEQKKFHCFRTGTERLCRPKRLHAPQGAPVSNNPRQASIKNPADFERATACRAPRSAEPRSRPSVPRCWHAERSEASLRKNSSRRFAASLPRRFWSGKAKLGLEMKEEVENYSHRYATISTVERLGRKGRGFPPP